MTEKDRLLISRNLHIEGFIGGKKVHVHINPKSHPDNRIHYYEGCGDRLEVVFLDREVY